MQNGYVDLQVNGFAGVDFNDPALHPDRVCEAIRSLREGGVAQILATVITDTPERMKACLHNLVAAREQDAATRETIVGFHLEGPFISPVEGFVGAHPVDAVCPANTDLTKELLEAGEGLVRLVTLAPEQDAGGKLSRFLSDQGILVSAGHTDASVDELKACIDQGLSLFTHLGNACPLFMHRHDNIIQRALSLYRSLNYGLVADGVHLPLFLLRGIIDLVGVKRCFVVTDAMAAAGLGPGRYTLGGQQVDVDETLAAWAPDRSHLMGSAATMARCAENLRTIGFEDATLSALLADNASRLLA